jgi:hypothetical protein
LTAFVRGTLYALDLGFALALASVFHYWPANCGNHLFDFADYFDRVDTSHDLVSLCALTVQDGQEDQKT